MLRRTAGPWPKRDLPSSCTPCLSLKHEIACRDACCRVFLVQLAQEDLDDGLVPWAPFVDVLAHRDDGTCLYLERTSGRCEAWERRPLTCRAYDCRDDERQRTIGAAPNTMRGALPERCHGCGRPAELLFGSREACAGFVVCIHCGAPFVLRALPGSGEISLTPHESSAEERWRYLLRSLEHRERWREVLLLLQRAPPEFPVEELERERGCALAELGRCDDAFAALAPLPGDEALVDRAWVLTRAHRDPEAAAQLRSCVAQLGGAQLVRARLILGGIAERSGDLDEAAVQFLLALRLTRSAGRRDTTVKSFVQRLLAKGEAGREAVAQAALALHRRDQLRRRRICRQVPGDASK